MNSKDLPRLQDLTPQKKEELLKRLKQRKEQAKKTLIVKNDSPPDQLPLSAIQKSMWLLQNQLPGSVTLNCNYVQDIKGPLDVERLQKALIRLLEQQSILRLGINEVSDSISGFLHPLDRFNLKLEDFSNSEDPMDQARASIRLAIESPFTLSPDEVLLRAKVIRISEQHHMFVMVIHHILTDGWSNSILMDSLSEAYNTDTELPPLDYSYFDYAATQRSSVETPVYKAGMQWWKQHVDGASINRLPFDFNDRQSSGLSTARAQSALSSSTMDQLKAIATSLHATPFAVLLAIYKAILFRYCSESDITVGIPAANRTKEEFHGLIGAFINTLPLQTHVEGDETLAELIGKIRDTSQEALLYQGVPLENLLEETHPERDVRGNAYFNTLFNYHLRLTGPMTIEDCDCQLLSQNSQIGQNTLVVTLFPKEKGSVLEFCYDDGLFLPETIERIRDRFIYLIENASSLLEIPVNKLPLAGEQERQQLMNWSKGKITQYGSGISIDEAFQRAVERNPSKVAIIKGDREISYELLSEKASKLARLLGRKGLAPDQVCAIHMDRSVDFIVTVLAIVKSGGVYLPLDPNLPQERGRYILEDAGAALLITDNDHLTGMILSDCEVLDIRLADSEMEQLDGPGSIPDADIDPTARVNIMYTSGSTGEPKGIEIKHQGIMRMVCEPVHNRIFEHDVVLFSSAVGFDASTWEIWGVLLNAATMVLLPPQSHDPSVFRNLIHIHRITTLSLPTALFHILASEDITCFEKVRRVIVGGESLQIEAAGKFLDAYPHIQLTNTYGPTENTTDSTWYVVPQDLDRNIRTVPIGRPIANSSAWVLDNYMELSPVGMPGELWLGGDGLAIGYVGKPDLTESAFVHVDKEYFSGRLYRSGDICRWNENGCLEFLGRVDNQVKYRGFRIELDEIEVALQRIPGIRQAAVFLDSESNGQQQLVAAVSSRTCEVNDIRSKLIRSLPPYMVPSIIEVHEEFPHNASGKIDRQKLLQQITDNAISRVDPGSDETSAFVDPTQSAIADIWEEVLGVRPGSPHESIFNLGGHSLKLIQIRSRIENRTGKSITIRDLYRNHVLEELAVCVDKAGKSTADEAVESRDTVLLTLQEGNNGQPIVGTYGHGHFSSPYVWNHALAYLDQNQAVYGIGGTDLQSERIRKFQFNSLKELAAAHCNDLMAIEMSNGIILFGYCAGGWLAYEIMLQLQARKIKADHIVMVDVLVPDIASRWNKHRRMHQAMEHARQALRKGPGYVYRYLLDRYKVRSTVKQKTRQAQRASDLIDSESVLTEEERLDYIQHQIGNVFTKWQPTAAKCTLDLIRSSHTTGAPRDYGWSDYIDGPIHIHEVDVPHNMMEKEYIPKVGPVFTKILERTN